MNIKLVPADESNYTKTRFGTDIDRIVMHWIVGSLEVAGQTFQNPRRNASAHYGVGDGEVHRFVDDEDTAWHSGNWEMNLRSIGIEHEGGQLVDGTRVKPSQRTHETSAKLVARLCQQYGIPADREHIIKHSEVKATQCPGTLDINQIIKKASDIMGKMEFTDQTKIPLGGDWGTIELQALRSILNDQKEAIKRIPQLEEDIRNLEGQIGAIGNGLQEIGASGETIEEQINSIKVRLEEGSEEPVFNHPLARALYQLAVSLG